MKPLNLSKADLYIQYFLVAINFGLGIFSLTTPAGVLLMLTFQIVINLYHFFTNFAHLEANHKSIGYTKYRLFYHRLTLIYVPTAALITYAIIDLGIEHTLSIATLLLIWLIIPQIVMHAYVYLSTKEANFIEQREFHILK